MGFRKKAIHLYIYCSYIQVKPDSADFMVESSLHTVEMQHESVVQDEDVETERLANNQYGGD
jgi:hypothetical protein